MTWLLALYMWWIEGSLWYYYIGFCEGVFFESIALVVSGYSVSSWLAADCVIIGISGLKCLKATPGAGDKWTAGKYLSSARLKNEICVFYPHGYVFYVLALTACFIIAGKCWLSITEFNFIRWFVFLRNFNGHWIIYFN